MTSIFKKTLKLKNILWEISFHRLVEIAHRSVLFATFNTNDFVCHIFGFCSEIGLKVSFIHKSEDRVTEVYLLILYQVTGLS